MWQQPVITNRMLQKHCQRQDPQHILNAEEHGRGFFDVDWSQIQCFIEKETPLATDTHSQAPTHGPQQQIPMAATSKEERGLEDSTDLAKRAVNHVIRRIEREGIEANWSDTDLNESQSNRSSSPNESSFSINNIWRSDWGCDSISNSFYNLGRAASYQSPIKQASNCHELSTHQSTASLSYSSYPQSIYSMNAPMMFYPQVPLQQIFEIVYDNILMDGRTTMMIKNIPNKYSLAALADEIDISHPNCYDFLYLPFDYNSKCNMGYAFINFLVPHSLKTFYEIYEKRKWLKFKSEKICVLTYARLQGKAELIEHFHSSKVYTQKGKQYRPLIRNFSDVKEIIAKQRQGTVADDKR